MAFSRSNFQLFLFVLTCSIDNVLSLENHTALFFFGDSIFDVGSNNHLKNGIKANFFPFGETFFKYPTGRFCDGRIIPDFIAEYAKLPFIPPYYYCEPTNFQMLMNGVNFASSGSGALVETRRDRAMDLKTQLNDFKKMKEQLRQKLGDEETNTLISNAVFSFSVGTNDYIAAAFPQSFVSRDEELVEIVIGNITDVIKEIYKEGGRKFAYVNVGPFDCAPPARARSPDGGCLEQLTAAFKQHNQKIPTVLQDLQSELHGFKYANFDFNKAFSERINNPSQYGFKEGKAACCEDRPYGGSGNCGKNNGTIRLYELCDNPNEYVFFDVHPTEKANEQFGELIWNGGVDYVSPINFRKLFEA